MTEDDSTNNIDNDFQINPNTPSDNLLETAINLACTDSQLFKNYCDTQFSQLTEDDQLILIEKGPVFHKKDGKEINLTLCQLNKAITFKDKTPLMASYLYLLEQLLPKPAQATKLSSIQITALFMQAMIIDKNELYQKLKALKLHDSGLTQLKAQFNTLKDEKKVMIVNFKKYLTQEQYDNLKNHITEQCKNINSFLLELKLKNQYNRAKLKSVALFNCYKESHIRYYFNYNFLIKSFNKFSMAGKKNFIKQLITNIDTDGSNPNIYALKVILIDQLDITIDVLFTLISNQIQAAPSKPSYYYHRWDERRVANAKKELGTGDIIDKSTKIRWIHALAADHQGCFPVTLFRSNRVEDNPIILYCKKWVDELNVQVKPYAPDSLEEEANTPTSKT